MSDEALILADDPAPHVRRLTLNRPAKRNALSNALRGEMFAALEAADRDAEVRVIVIRGAGTCFSSGYDLAGLGPLPFHTAGHQGSTPCPRIGPTHLPGDFARQYRAGSTRDLWKTLCPCVHYPLGCHIDIGTLGCQDFASD